MYKGPVVGIKDFKAYLYAGNSFLFPLSNSPVNSYIWCPCNISSWEHLYLIIFIAFIYLFRVRSIWWSGGKLQESDHSSREGPGNQILVVRLGGKCLYHHLADPTLAS